MKKVSSYAQLDLRGGAIALVAAESGLPVPQVAGEMCAVNGRLWMSGGSGPKPAMLPVSVEVPTAVHSQGLLSSSWLVTHNFGSTGTVVASAWRPDGTPVVPISIILVSTNQCRLVFDTIVDGSAVVALKSGILAEAVNASLQVRIGTAATAARSDHVHPAQTTVTGNAGTSTKLTTARTLSITGDLTWTSPTFDGSASVTAAGTLAASGVVAGTYNDVATAVRPFTVDTKGRVTAIGAAVTIAPAFASVTGKPTTLAGYGITDAAAATHNHAGVYQPIDADLTAIAGIAETAGLLKETAADTWALDSSAYLVSNQPITVSGDAAGTGTTAIALTLANSGVAAGTYRSVTVDVKGRVTAGTNPTTLAGYGITDAASDVDLANHVAAYNPHPQYVMSSTCKTTGTVSSSLTTLANVTGAAIALLANSLYRVTMYVRFSSTASGTGIRLGLTCPTGATISAQVSIPVRADSTSGCFQGSIVVSGDSVTATGVEIAGTAYVAVIQGVIQTGATAGNLQLQYATEVSGSSVSVLPMSVGFADIIA